MKRIFILFAFSLFLTTSIAQKNPSKFPATLITVNNDTIKAQIILSGHSNNIELSDLFVEVTYEDSAGGKFTVRPNEHILSFQFNNKHQIYYFERIALKGTEPKKQEYGFGLCIVKGYLSLYQYSFDLDAAILTTTLSPGKPSAGNFKQRYIYNFLQKHNLPPSLVKRKPSFTGMSPNNEKKWLKHYFKDYPQLAKKIGKEIKTYDLEAMVKEYNDWREEKK